MAAEPGLSLAQDLCARLCHDLVGPLGTVAGAVEMVGDDPEAAELAREAALSLRGRLQLWRAACGAGTGPMKPPDMAALLEGNLAGGRASLALGALPPGESFAAPVAQLLLVGAMLGGEALPRGGVVHLLPQGGGVAVRPEGRVLNWPPALAAALAGEPAEGPRAVLAPLLAQLAGAAGWQARLTEEALLLHPLS
ncbi:histidine phosphotransferase family protein [Pseudoroseomonas ludipueritiae]